jgi:hypothetical protein
MSADFIVAPGGEITANQPDPAGVVLVRLLNSIKPAPENDDIYSKVSVDDPATIGLARSIKENGLLEPIIISEDGYIISGHRRWFASKLAGLREIRVCVRKGVNRGKDPKKFLRLLVEANTQRIKNTSTHIKESMIKIDPQVAHAQIRNDRKRKDEDRENGDLSAIDPDDDGRRKAISKAKYPLLNAVIKVLNDHRDYWPMSVRQIHYRLLGPDAPLKHASKPGSKYVNDKSSYTQLTDIVARGRIAGHILWSSVEDETRPTDEHRAFWNTRQFFDQEIENLLKGYWRNLQQSQPHHVEIVAEKLTVRSLLQEVAKQYCIPLTISRGISSLPPKKAIVDRFGRSKKGKLILLVVSDLDPAGRTIAEDLVKSFRRDFGIHNIEAYKVALAIDQVDEFDLEPSMDAKESSPGYDAYLEEYGITDAYELEALQPEDLKGLLESAIDDVIDLDLYNHELEAEEADSTNIIAVQQQVHEFLRTLDLGKEEGSE